MDRSCAFLRLTMRRTPSACVRSLLNESPGVEAIDRAPVVRGEFERRDGPKPELVPTESARTPCHWRGTESRKQRRVRGRSLIITVGPLWHCPRSNGKNCRAGSVNGAIHRTQGFFLGRNLCGFRNLRAPKLYPQSLNRSKIDLPPEMMSV